MEDKEKRITINREAGAMVDLLNNEIEELQKAKAIEEMEDIISGSWNTRSAAKNLSNAGYRKISENEVVIDKNENPCLSCPVPEDIQRDVDCSTICGAVRLGIDWQNQCKVLVKENKQLTKELAQARKETAEKILRDLYSEATSNVSETVELTTFQIEQLAKQFGLEIKE